MKQATTYYQLLGQKLYEHKVTSRYGQIQADVQLGPRITDDQTKIEIPSYSYHGDAVEWWKLMGFRFDRDRLVWYRDLAKPAKGQSKPHRPEVWLKCASRKYAEFCPIFEHLNYTRDSSVRAQHFPFEFLAIGQTFYMYDPAIDDDLVKARTKKDHGELPKNLEVWIVLDEGEDLRDYYSVAVDTLKEQSAASEKPATMSRQLYEMDKRARGISTD